MRMTGAADREKRIRELAVAAVETGTSPMTVFPIQTSRAMFVPPGKYAPVANTTIMVDLYPGLRGTQEGILIAETMIRDAWDCAAEGILDR